MSQLDAPIETCVSAQSGRAPAVPDLVVTDRVRPMAEVPDPLPPGVEVCYDARGDLLAYCRAEAGTLRVDMPDVASFCYERGAGHVRAILHRPLPLGFILDTYHHCVLPLMLPALGTEVLHASAVAGLAGVAALCGASGTGKSTIAVALARRGYAIWADDAVAVDVAEPAPTAIPLPFASRLRADSAGYLAAAGEQEPAVASAATAPAPLAALCMLRRAPDATAPVVIERLAAAAACRAALAHAHCFTVKDPAQKRRTIANYLTMTGRVPVYEIRFRPGLECFPAVLDAIEAIVGRAATHPI